MLLRKPFSSEELITSVAACLNQPWSPEHYQQAAVLEGFVAALARKVVEAAIAWCLEEVQCYLWLIPPIRQYAPLVGGQEQHLAAARLNHLPHPRARVDTQSVQHPLAEVG